MLIIKVGNIEVYGIIYDIRNKINNKHYIGQTIEEKGFNGRYCRKGEGIKRFYSFHKALQKANRGWNKHLISSIEKYGFDNFEVNEIKDIAFSQYELNVKEQCWISIYDSLNNGYNQTIGGEGAKGIEPLFGVLNTTSKSIVQLSLKGEFIKQWDSMADAERELNINKSHICDVCNNRRGRKSTGGFMWLYENDYEELKYSLEFTYNNNCGEYNREPVVQLSLKGEFIDEYISISEATRAIENTNASKISLCCKNVRKSHRGYLWIYKKDYDKDKLYIWDGIHKGNKKKIIQLSLGGVFISEYESLSMASELVPNTMPSKISLCCRGDRKSHANFIWVFKSDYNENKIYTYNTKHTGKSKGIIQLDLEGRYIKEYTSLSNAERETGISRGNITSCLTGKNKTAGGYKWEYKIS